MKHVFYVFYVLAFSGAVFMTGMFIGQFLERRWSVRAERKKRSNKRRGNILLQYPLSFKPQDLKKTVQEKTERG